MNKKTEYFTSTADANEYREASAFLDKHYSAMPILFSKTRAMLDDKPVYKVNYAPDYSASRGLERWKTGYARAAVLNAKWNKVTSDGMLPEMIIHHPCFSMILRHDVAEDVICSGILPTLVANGWQIEVR